MRTQDEIAKLLAASLALPRLLHFVDQPITRCSACSLLQVCGSERLSRSSGLTWILSKGF
jgi:hypothetical protein